MRATGLRLLFGAVALSLVGGCGAAASVLPEPPARTADGPVKVVRSSLASVLTMDATLAQGVPIAVPAHADAVFVAQVNENARVAEGAVLGMLGDAPVKAPVGGRIAVVRSGRAVKNATLVTIEAEGIVVSGVVPFEARYRLGTAIPSKARAQIVGGPGPTDCTPLGAPVITEGKVSFACRLDGVPLYPGLPAVLAVNLDTRQGVLTLPLSAVAGTAEVGEVNLVNADGSTTLKRVSLGLTDGARVEITDGLAEGDAVSSSPPRLKVS